MLEIVISEIQIIPVKPKDGRPFIVKLFSDLVNAIKTLFAGKSAQSITEQLFKNINEGQYKEVVPYESALSFANFAFNKAS